MSKTLYEVRGEILEMVQAHYEQQHLADLELVRKIFDKTLECVDVRNIENAEDLVKFQQEMLESIQKVIPHIYYRRRDY